MSDKLNRYNNPEIYEHLAAQYVAGALHPRVRARMQRLIESEPEIRQAVEFWTEQFSEVQYRLPEETPSGDVLTNITKQLGFTEKASEKWWHKLWAWQLTSAISLALSGFLAVNSFVQSPGVVPPPPVITSSVSSVGASYLAVMSLHEQDKIEFVISAYAKQEGQPSRLHVQWSAQSDKKWRSGVHLWSEDRETGQVVYIGKKPAKGKPWDLQKSEWQTITNSGRLLMTNNSEQPSQKNTIFSGECLQLKEWKKPTA